MENIIGIAENIKERLCDEFRKGLPNRAIARVFCERRNESVTYFLTNKTNESVQFGHNFVGGVVIIGQQTTSSVGTTVYKNTLLGRALIGKLGEEAQYKAPKGLISIKPMTRAVYSPFGENAEDVQISLAGDENRYIYASLKELLDFKSAEEDRLKAEQERLVSLRQEQEILKQKEAEAKARAAEEERVRLEEERIKREQEEKDRKEEIARIEQNIIAAEENIKQQRALLHKNAMLRSQHILDTYQEDAKRSHIYDGEPILIEGGPGTGKTTTVIQRLKFLLSKQSLEEYSDLTPNQIERFADPHRWSQQWLFFSPTELLLQYLRNNMREEELNANDSNTRTIKRFRDVMLRDYGIIAPSNSKFCEWKDRSGDMLILNPKEVISQFEGFCVAQINQIRSRLLAFDTSDFAWSFEAESIKKICSQNEIRDIASLMRLLESLYNHRDTCVEPVDDSFRGELNDAAMTVKREIVKDEGVVESLKELFVLWQKKAKQVFNQTDESVDDSDEEILDENDGVSELEKIDFDTELYANIRNLIRTLGLKMVDSSVRVRGRQQELLKIVEPFIEKNIDQNYLKYIGGYVLFSKEFASFCRGSENIFINRIPQMYKLFRKEQVNDETSFYNRGLLDAVVKKNNNKCLHIDEQNLLLGFINNTLISFSRMFRSRFEELKGKFTKTYKENCRPIIGIDEATDYSLMDFYCMMSFRYNEFSSITLSGDLMQGMHKNGIDDWNELSELFPKLEKFSLNISYRQSPTLVEMARELYKDSIGEYPTYNSKNAKRGDEAKPILLISDDMEEKAAWICNHIVDIYKKYDLLPSIAIFVGDDVDVKQFIETLEDTYILNGIEVVDCSDGKTLDSKEVVRVFRLSEIKGMEFEAAFFYDIDTAIQGKSKDLMRRNLYVGVSRAASHLAATMTTAEGNESIIKYFETENVEW